MFLQWCGAVICIKLFFKSPQISVLKWYNMWYFLLYRKFERGVPRAAAAAAAAAAASSLPWYQPPPTTLAAAARVAAAAKAVAAATAVLGRLGTWGIGQPVVSPYSSSRGSSNSLDAATHYSSGYLTAATPGINQHQLTTAGAAATYSHRAHRPPPPQLRRCAVGQTSAYHLDQRHERRTQHHRLWTQYLPSLLPRSTTITTTTTTTG